MTSGDGILLDSVILIDHFNGVARATAFIKEVSAHAAISAITRAEVMTGFEEDAAVVARRLVDFFLLVIIDAPIADLAATLRRRHRWKLPDALQAAAAIHHGMRLATRNTKDFDPSTHPFVVVPYTLEPRG